MEDEELIRTDIELAIADAQWRDELTKTLKTSPVEDDLIVPAMKGEPETTLRAAYEQRVRALDAWRQSRGIA